jgi:parvulin-like peptidyl-prolyl isomerase
MSRACRCIPALGAVLFALIGLSACGGIPSNAVVQVNGNPITKATFAHWMAVAATSTSAGTGAKAVVPVPPDYKECIAHLQATTPTVKGQPAPTQAQLKAQCEQQYKALQQEVLGFLISSSWVLGEAESLGVHVSDKEVHKRFEEIKSQQFPRAAEFEKFLASSGQSVSDLLLRVKLNLISQKVQQKIAKKNATITHAQIAQSYKENPQRFGQPEKRNLKVILTKTEEAANKAKKEIASGKSWASVAKSASIDPVTKNNGGVLVGVVKGQEEKSLDSAVFAAKTNVVQGPIKTVFGYYIFEVTSITPGNQLTLAQAEASIRQQLIATHQQAALTSFIKEFKKRWQAKTECRPGYVQMNCKEYKAPKTPSGVTPGVPQTTTPTQTSTTTTPTTTTTKK